MPQPDTSEQTPPDPAPDEPLTITPAEIETLAYFVGVDRDTARRLRRLAEYTRSLR